jgi:hypothetical protein
MGQKWMSVISFAFLTLIYSVVSEDMVWTNWG